MQTGDVPDVDVTIIGAGIAGAALAAFVARAGLRVLVLERDLAPRDRGRGEYLQPWGVAEADRLGVTGALLGAGAVVGERFVRYSIDLAPAVAEARALDLTRAVTGVPGSLQVGHPQACTGLADSATDEGAEIRRGARSIVVRPGTRPQVSWSSGGRDHNTRSRLVVGADGRRSSVRRQCGQPVLMSTARNVCDVVLVEAAPGWPPGWNVAITDRDVHLFALDRGFGLVRVYLFHDIGAPVRHRSGRPLTDVGAVRFPGATVLSEATSVSPVIRYPVQEAVTPVRAAPGVLLIGDAAGWSNPLIGQGLSVSLRDARRVGEILATESCWGPAAFADHANTRSELLRRLRVSAWVARRLHCRFGEPGLRARALYAAAAEQDNLIAAPVDSYVSGPESAPAEAFSTANVQRISKLLA